MIRRREFMTLLGGAAAWPLVAHAQQDGRMRRVAVLTSYAESDPLFQTYLFALRQGLQQLGWVEGRNLQLDRRFSARDFDRRRASAQELIGLAPDVIVVGGADGTRSVQTLTRTIPIVFIQVGDPVASGVVKRIARPEGNTTGITNQPASIAGKWLELLKEAAPQIARATLIFDAGFPVTETYLGAIEAAAPANAVMTIRAPVRSAAEIERAVGALASEPNGGLVVVPPPFIDTDRELILQLTRRHGLPTVTYDRNDTAAGYLMSYGPNAADIYRSAASYVDRILRGAKPSELPVQFPTKFELVINLKTAKALNLDVPLSLQQRADEVIE
jgi:putative ABC transport system substrate-binding protein